MKEKEILKEFSMYLRSASVESGPPLSTILGNYGVNTVKFCEEFNNETKELPSYFLLKVSIVIFTDKTYSFSIQEPSTSYFLRLVSYDKSIFVKSMGGLKKKLIKVVRVEDFYLVTFLKFGYVNKKCLNMVLGTMRSMSLLFDFDNVEEEKENI